MGVKVKKLQVKFKLWLNSKNVEGVFGDGKWRLLKAVDAEGSLKAASEKLHISYRKAWGDLKKAQDALHVALVEKRRGGNVGGQTVLTEQGRQWVEAYTKFRGDVEEAVERGYKKHFKKPSEGPKTSKVRSRRALDSAFSLVELLVVVSVIALLMGLVLPALSRARLTAKQTVCQSRLRQWGLAFEIYAVENEGFYPHIDGRDRTSSDPRTYAELADYYFGWIDVLPPLMGAKAWRDHDYWQKPGTGTVFQCPTAKLAPDESYKYRPRRSGYFSYAMNSCLELDENCWAPYGCEGTDWCMPSFLKVTSIRNSARLILLFDQLLDPEKGYGGMKYNPTAGKYCGSYPKAFSARHAKPGGLLGGSILHCDYHVGWQSSVWKSEWPDDLEVPPLGDPDWFP